MKYLLLLYGDPDAEAALTDAERRAIVDEHIRFGRVLDERNAALVVGEALDGPAGTKTVRFAPDGGEAYVTDGPFLEAKESIGGFYVLSCADLDEALDLATQVPRSPGLVAELHPIAGS